ncbi:MAG: hypothetical protein E6G51_07560 [Actinobacteria bacterium]|nr:MAG: hypothetical protein E6G51_07560 [Actinomycetota bacterium]
MAKHLLAPSPGNATFLTVGSLHFDGYLKDVEARTALGILSTRQEELDELSDRARNEFLEQAGRFVDSVRASIFWGQVKKRLLAEDGHPGQKLFIREMPSRGRRDDFLAGRADLPVRVAPAFVIDSGSSILRQVVARLEGEGSAAAGGRERQIIVIPDHSQVEEVASAGGAPRIVKLKGLREALLEPS